MRFVLFLLVSAAAFAQGQVAETPALQALLTEVHALRVDLQTTAITMQRVQIVLYRLQSQTALATRAASQYETARTQIGYIQSERKMVSGRVQQMENSLRDAQDPAERKRIEDILSQLKMTFERSTFEEQRLQTALIDAEAVHRAEQNKVADLQGQLDRLDKVLDGLSRK